jgi:nanoRNase/pAp phosphatase (c-di-AMP/oligoRNAs hydrolase)
MSEFDLEKAIASVKGRGPALVLMHDNPDPDCMAAAECLRALLWHEAQLPVTVARGGYIGRAENRAMVNVLGLSHVSVERIDFSSYPVIALVDTQPETGNNSLPKLHRVDIVVDHHPLRPAARRAPWCDVREDFGASSTITYTYLKDRKVEIEPRLATALLYAIKAETRDLVREASDHDHEAFSDLLKIADFDKLSAISEPKVPAAHFMALDRALRGAEVRGPLLACSLGGLDYPDLVAEIADLLLPYEKAHWVLCVGHYRGNVYLSVRTDVPNAHAGGLIRQLVGENGAAGGHGAVAGGKLHVECDSDEGLGPLYQHLVDRMAELLKIPNKKSQPMLKR